MLERRKKLNFEFEENIRKLHGENKQWEQQDPDSLHLNLPKIFSPHPSLIREETSDTAEVESRTKGLRWLLCTGLYVLSLKKEHQKIK